MTHLYKNFHLHGDNIVECERTVKLICLAIADITQNVRGPFGSPVCPSYEIVIDGEEVPIHLTLFPGFGRWNADILELVRQRGGTLREAADCIITGVADGREMPLIAIEYCGALPAGNQAWQRSGRAYSFGKAEIPYLYVAELGGFELDAADRKRKAARLPNPAVPFSYLAFSLNHPTTVLPVFLTSPGASEISRAEYADVFAEAELLALLRASVLGYEDSNALTVLRTKALSFVKKRAASSRKGKTLTPQQWHDAYQTLQSGGGTVVDYLAEKARLPWSKIAYIEAITDTARKLMNFTASIAFGLTAGDLPMCVVPKEKRNAFASEVERQGEGRIQPEFLAWLRQERHLSICWVMGFKPKGDDARPDRGLPPLTRMLIGSEADLLTVVYGPAPAASWSLLHTNPLKLSISNGLWQAIFNVSDAVLVDSSTDGIRHHGYLSSHWHDVKPKPDMALLLVKPEPLLIGENDVDTVLHLLLAHHSGSAVFEGLCNPPGGDWSGVSLQTPDRATELRWLSLPRVSDVGGKRPDHVFQIFRDGEKPILLAVESKETADSVETGIGPRLLRYLEKLTSTPASIERKQGTTWNHSALRLDTTEFTLVSAAAFKSDNAARTESVKSRADSDLLMAFRFDKGGQSCIIEFIPVTAAGQTVADFMGSLFLQETNLRVTVNAVQQAS